MGLILRPIAKRIIRPNFSRGARITDFRISRMRVRAGTALALRPSVIRHGGTMMHRLLVLTAAVSLLAAGCNMPGARLNAPPHGRACETSDLQGTYTYMGDNALLADMTVNDSHFLPHRAALNDLGIQRLSRLASLMEAYAGTIRFDTQLTEKDLIAQRVEVVRDFLAEAGIDTTHEVVVREMAGGQGMPATEAILIKVKEGTYDAEKKQSQGTSTGATAAK
jgi:hypothetical protein